MAKKKWEEMSRPERRVQVAKDVIKQLNLKRIQAETGMYCGIYSISPEADKQKELSKLLKKESKPCVVCGIGALFVAKVYRENKLDATAYKLPNYKSTTDICVGRPKIVSYVRDAFNARQLDQIEEWFEGNSEVQRNYPNDEDRLRAIMEHIIKNEGRVVNWKEL